MFWLIPLSFVAIAMIVIGKLRSSKIKFFNQTSCLL